MAKFRSFKAARKYVHSLELKNQRDWADFSKSNKKPGNIPAAPWYAYKNKGWQSLGDWLGTGTIASQKKQYRSFEKARKFVIALKLKNREDWKKLIVSDKLPPDIPNWPDSAYKKQGWINWGDWFGTGNIAHKDLKFRSFKQARKYVHSLGLKSQRDWNQYRVSGKRPKDVASNPRLVYKKEWKGWGDWLGTGAIAPQLKNYRAFDKARKFVHTLDLSARSEWQKFAKSGKLPKDIPNRPDHVYRDKGWKNWGGWLGTGFIATSKRIFLSFDKARKFAQSLELKSQREWRLYVKSGKMPKNIPQNPARTYPKEWKSYGDWLGTGRIADQYKVYLQFKEARKEARSLAKRYGIKTMSDWVQAKRDGKIPANIPASPRQVYSKDRVFNKRKKK